MIFPAKAEQNQLIYITVVLNLRLSQPSVRFKITFALNVLRLSQSGTYI